MSNFWVWFFMFSLAKNNLFFPQNIVVSTLKSCIKKGETTCYSLHNFYIMTLAEAAQSEKYIRYLRSFKQENFDNDKTIIMFSLKFYECSQVPVYFIPMDYQPTASSLTPMIASW